MENIIHNDSSVDVRSMTYKLSHESHSSIEEDECKENDKDGSRKKKTFRCPYKKCSSAFYRKAHLQDHLNRHKGVRIYECKEEDCSKSYFKWIDLRKHLANFHGLDMRKSLYVTKDKTHVCPYTGCNATFLRPGRLASHMCTHSNVKLYPCLEDGCKRSYTMMGHLKRHISNTHKQPADFVTQYLCTKEGCKKAFKSLNFLRRHYSNYHADERLEDASVKCPTCHIHFKTEGRLGIHKSIHHSNPPYKCSEEGCEKTYKSTDGLRRHYSHYHGTSFKCPLCNKCFKTSDLLDIHKNTHSNNPLYKCEECGENFMDTMVWKEHKKTHSHFVCQMSGCAKTFSQDFLLQKHQEQMHKKSFICEYRDKTFNGKGILKRHQENHLSRAQRTLFCCPHAGCGRCYTRKYNLNQHIRSKHEDKKLLCGFPGCQKRLVTKQKLQEHIMKIHDPSRLPPVRKQMARRQRKDAGKPKRSMAVKLSGIKIPYINEKKILLAEEIQNYDSETSDSCDEWSESCESHDE